MKTRHKRIALIAGGLAVLGIATALVLSAFQSNLLFFFTPTQVAAGGAPQERAFRVGGMVQTGSVRREGDGLTVNFVVTGTANTIPVSYTWILPDLFSDGRGVVDQGKLYPDGLFHTQQVLTYHDQNYMTREEQHELDHAGKTSDAPRSQYP